MPENTQLKNANLLAAYLDAYASRDITRVAAMFDDDIHLRDWNISVVGKPAALAETQKNFESARSIKIETLQVFHAAHSVAAELRIVVNEAIELHVTDVVQFGESGLINAIRAYRGRSSVVSRLK